MDAHLVGVLGTVITMLLAGNLYFIKRLIDKVDVAADQAKTASSAVSELKTEIKELRRLEIDVAVMKAALFPRVRPPLPAQQNHDSDYAKVG